jgi:hypothetical protein
MRIVAYLKPTEPSGVYNIAQTEFPRSIYSIITEQLV